jgi:hypothetical protein
MSILKLIEDGFEHGTVRGFAEGCRGAHCPSEVSCRTVHMRYSGDYSFRKRIDAGMTVAEILELEASEAVVGAALVAAAKHAAREAERARPVKAPRVAREPRQPRQPREPRAPRMSAEQREAKLAEQLAAREQRKAKRAAERAALRLERETSTAEERAQRAIERAAEREAKLTEKRAAREALRSPKPITHGTNAGYARGCQCGPCTDAHRSYHREYSARRRAQPIPAEHHGTPYGYQLGCKNRDECPAEISCADASLAEERRRRRENGIPARELVPSDTVRAHVVELHKTLSYTRIGKLAGIAPKDVRRLVTGRDDGPRKGEVAKHTDRAKAERILAVVIEAAA